VLNTRGALEEVLAVVETPAVAAEQRATRVTAAREVQLVQVHPGLVAAVAARVLGLAVAMALAAAAVSESWARELTALVARLNITDLEDRVEAMDRLATAITLTLVTLVAFMAVAEVAAERMRRFLVAPVLKAPCVFSGDLDARSPLQTQQTFSV
jgi:hypothetical protein